VNERRSRLTNKEHGLTTGTKKREEYPRSLKGGGAKAHQAPASVGKDQKKSETSKVLRGAATGKRRGGPGRKASSAGSGNENRARGDGPGPGGGGTGVGSEAVKGGEEEERQPPGNTTDSGTRALQRRGPGRRPVGRPQARPPTDGCPTPITTHERKAHSTQGQGTRPRTRCGDGDGGTKGGGGGV